MSGVADRQPIRPPLNFAQRFFRGNAALFNLFDPLEQLYDLLPVGLACINRDFRLTKINKTLADWMGQTPVGLNGRRVSEAIPLAPENLEADLLRSLDTGESLGQKIWQGVPFQGAAEQKWRASFFPQSDARGPTEEIFLILEDVTSLQKLTEDCERSERDRQVQRLELEHVRRVSTVGDLASSLAHELNQPLAAILSNAQAALRFLTSNTANIDEVKEILKDIVSDDKRAGEVIRHMRSLLRKSELEDRPLALNELVMDVEKILRSHALLRRSAIRLDLAPDLPLIRGDSIQLQQVLLNLALNGLDAMRDTAPPERLLVIRTRRVGIDAQQVSVIDAGHGVDKDQVSQIFEPFFTTKKEGLGMGLSISRSIVEAHRGRLWMEPNLEQGSSFHFTLPFPKARSLETLEAR